MANIINDDVKLLAINKSSTAEKFLSIKETLATRDLPSYGNNLPAGVAITESNYKEKHRVIGAEEIEKAVHSLNEHIKEIKRELHFNIDKGSGQTVITVIDSVTNEVVRQIPNEEAVNVARRLVEGSDISLLSEYS